MGVNTIEDIIARFEALQPPHQFHAPTVDEAERRAFNAGVDSARMQVRQLLAQLQASEAER